MVRMYTDEEVLELDKARKKYLQTLQDRIEAYHEIVEKYKEKKELIKPDELLQAFAIIDMAHPVI